MSVLLAYIMLLGPGWFESSSQAVISYGALTKAAWGVEGTSVEYTYDDNGSVRTKITPSVESIIYTYDYNLEGRLRKVTHDVSGAASDDVVEYTYNDAGIRVRAFSYDTSDGGQTQDNPKTTVYLVGSYNHTG